MNSSVPALTITRPCKPPEEQTAASVENSCLAQDDQVHGRINAHHRTVFKQVSGKSRMLVSDNALTSAQTLSVPDEIGSNNKANRLQQKA